MLFPNIRNGVYFPECPIYVFSYSRLNISSSSDNSQDNGEHGHRVPGHSARRHPVC